MSIEKCLRTARQGGEITTEEEAAMMRLYDSLVRHYGEPNKAKAEMVDRLIRKAQHQERQALLSDEARERIENFMLNYRNARGEPDPAKAFVAILEHNGQVPMPAGMSSVYGRAQAIMGLAMGEIENVLHEFRRTWIKGATRNVARLENVVREAAGEETGDAAAKALARAWLHAADKLRQRFNAAGGAIGELQGWFLPQIHDRMALLKRGKSQWISDIEPMLDLSRMRHPLTGNPMTRDDLLESLDWIWATITTDGWHAREATSQRAGLGALSSQRADHRFLHFKSADLWLQYQRDYGGGADPFAAMMNHIRGMSEDIGAMEILGPNPEASMVYLENFVLKQAAQRVAGVPSHFPVVTGGLSGRSMEAGGSWLATKDPEDYARDAITLARDMWSVYRHAADAAVNRRIADVFGTMRNMNVATKLGSASLSAVTDLGFQQVARGFIGLPVLSVYGDVVKSFSTATKRELVAAGLILDTAVNVLHNEARFAAGMQGPAWSRVLADRVIAWSGLSAWTQAGRHAFGLSVMATLAQNTHLRFDAMPEGLQRLFQRYGITAEDWDFMRLNLDPETGSLVLLKPSEVARVAEVAGRSNERIAERYLEMILQETEYAVPAGTLQAKARAYAGLRRGVLQNEIWRSGGQFKMFGLSVALLQGQRIASEMTQRGFWRGAGYASALVITTTLYGALAMQLKEIAKGKDPRPMNDPKFWGGAIFQGGGLGIFGDFISSESARTGGGLAQVIAGPTADVVGGGLSILSKQVSGRLYGEPQSNAGRELIRFLGQNTPGGSLWYVRSAYERILLDELQRLADPEAHTAFRRKISQQLKNYGNNYWWKPGAGPVPQRGPRINGQ